MVLIALMFMVIMVGATPELFAILQPVLAQMGRNIVLCGEVGTGQIAKICNNLVLGISMIAVSEAFVMAEKLGLSALAMFDIVSSSSGSCWALVNHCPVPGPVPTSAENSTAADHIMPHFWQTAADTSEVAQQRHAQASNYSFVDGHASARRFLETYAPDQQIDAWNPSLAH